jgi:hypothetical protein
VEVQLLSGIYYVEQVQVTGSLCSAYTGAPTNLLQCQGAFNFTPITSGDCTNFSANASLYCAWGGGDDCQICPTGALCPGGYRIWPRPGYWTDDFASGTSASKLVSCRAPPFERCLGYNTSSDQSQCGPGYTGFACGACSYGYYPNSAGACVACQSGNSVTGVVYQMLEFLAALALLGLCTFFLLVLVLRKFGGSLAGGAMRTAQFCVSGMSFVLSAQTYLAHMQVWTFTVIQVIVQVGRAAGPGMPGFVASFYAGELLPSQRCAT